MLSWASNMEHDVPLSTPPRCYRTVVSTELLKKGNETVGKDVNKVSRFQVTLREASCFLSRVTENQVRQSAKFCSESERTRVPSGTLRSERERAKTEIFFFRPPTFPYSCSVKRHCKCECSQRRSSSFGYPHCHWSGRVLYECTNFAVAYSRKLRLRVCSPRFLCLHCGPLLVSASRGALPCFGVRDSEGGAMTLELLETGRRCEKNPV